jgi:glycosyltransferase involved in cell wall biosynthesis
VKNSANQGTYITRNQAFKMAKGKYFTVLDGDDFALPNRIEMQVKHLENNINHVGVVFKWVRMSINGKLEFRSWLGGNYLHEAVATMMIRRGLAIQKAGYWDSVRFAADTEYQYRLKRIFGNESLPTLDLPACISLSHPESLTNDKITGINTAVKGLSPIRLAYRESWKNWHEKTSREDLFVPHPNIARKFEAPIEML